MVTKKTIVTKTEASGSDEQRESLESPSSPKAENTQVKETPTVEGKLHLGGPHHGKTTVRTSTEGANNGRTVTYIPLEIEGKQYWGDNQLTRGQIRNQLLKLRKERNEPNL